ncbi:hypothetical protein [Maridesulfovibrio sp.]|uniref:hypothetical protein n=1 Tax=Maridesulfovibrio sp. TaxID=2795000 RepID=UPI002A18CCEE|nr:hypothetical protein [Maridesulfovibrio sp.]
MNKQFEDVIMEINNVSAALEFISESIECHAAEGRSINVCGLAYLTKMLGVSSSNTADICWGLFPEVSAGNSESRDS